MANTETAGKQLAVIRLRGRTGIRQDVEDTFAHLNLHRINNCVILEESPVVLGMLRKVKDHVTWGQVDADVLKALKEKRGKHGVGKEHKPVFRLSPPKGGLGRRGIKAAFANSGALGNRREKINDLIKKMI